MKRYSPEEIERRIEALEQHGYLKKVDSLSGSEHAKKSSKLRGLREKLCGRIRNVWEDFYDLFLSPLPEEYQKRLKRQLVISIAISIPTSLVTTIFILWLLRRL